jgi:hypothetical protein
MYGGGRGSFSSKLIASKLSNNARKRGFAQADNYTKRIKAAANTKKLENNTLNQMYSMGNNAAKAKAAANAQAAKNKAARKQAEANQAARNEAARKQAEANQAARNEAARKQAEANQAAKNEAARKQAEGNQGSANLTITNRMTEAVGKLLGTTPKVETAVSETVSAANGVQEAATQMKQNNSSSAASALVSETSTAVAKANNAVNNSKKLLNLAKNVNAIATRLRNMTTTSGGKRRTRRKHCTRRRRN